MNEHRQLQLKLHAFTFVDGGIMMKAHDTYIALKTMFFFFDPHVSDLSTHWSL
jgi:hypothetical protein